MPKRDKIIIASSMSLGVFAGACGIKRAIELRNLGSPNYLSTSPYQSIIIGQIPLTRQTPEDVVGIIIWHAAELCTTMVCIGIPVCRPLYKDWVGRYMSSEDSRDNSGGWMGGRPSKQSKQSSTGVFGLQTIGGTEYQNITEGLAGSSVRTKQDDGNLTDEDVILRRDVNSKVQQEISVQSGYPAVAGRSAANNGSEESIIGENSRGSVTQRSRPSIVVQKEFRVERT
jgi:hypothetical protein